MNLDIGQPLTNILKMQEAYAVMHGIPVERRFTDEQLEGYQYELSVAKTDIEEMEKRRL